MPAGTLGYVDWLHALPLIAVVCRSLIGAQVANKTKAKRAEDDLRVVSPGDRHPDAALLGNHPRSSSAMVITFFRSSRLLTKSRLSDSTTSSFPFVYRWIHAS